MLKVSRILILALCAAFLATGSTLAQGAPPPAGSPAPQAHKSGCKQTAQGCKKKKQMTQKKASQPTSGKPASGMPPPSPHP